MDAAVTNRIAKQRWPSPGKRVVCVTALCPHSRRRRRVAVCEKALSVASKDGFDAGATTGGFDMMQVKSARRGHACTAWHLGGACHRGLKASTHISQELIGAGMRAAARQLRDVNFMGS
eukprot:363931-Chlamydomonas_euryale.AAC.8